MPSYSTNALVLNKTKLGEADLIITFLSQEGRQVRAVAKGARKPASRYSATLELFSLVDLLLYTGKNLDTVNEAHILDSNAAVRRDLDHSSAASVLAEMLAKLTADGVEEQVLFPFARASLEALGQAETPFLPLYVATIMLKLASLVGYRPSLDRCALCGAPCDNTGFSLHAGGSLCASCAGAGVLGGMDRFATATLDWAKVAIGSTFLDLADLFPSDPDEAWRLGGDLFSLADAWCSAHLSLRLKAVEFYRVLVAGGIDG